MRSRAAAQASSTASSPSWSLTERGRTDQYSGSAARAAAIATSHARDGSDSANSATAAARLAAGLKLGHSSPYQVDVFSLMPELITGSTRSLAAPR